MMLETVSIYLLFILSVFFPNRFLFFLEKKKHPYIGTERKNAIRYYVILILPCLICSIIYGFRYNQGVDWAVFVDIFTRVNKGGRTYAEGGYVFLNKLLGSGLGFNYWSIYFFEMVVIYYSLFCFSKCKKEILFIGPTLFILYELNNIEGLSRQFFAMAILLYGIKYLLNNKLRYYFIFVILASLIHSSAILIFALYYIIKHIFKTPINIYISLLMYVIIFFGASKVIDFILVYIDVFSSLTGKSNYDSYTLTEVFINTSNKASNLRFFLLHFVNLTTIIAGYYVIKRYSLDKTFIFIYNCAVLGCIFLIPFTSYNILARLNMYFICMLPFVLSFVLYYVRYDFLQVPIYIKIPAVLSSLYLFYSYMGIAIDKGKSIQTAFYFLWEKEGFSFFLY